MIGRGRFFMLTDAELRALKKHRGDPARRAAVDAMEESWDADRAQDTDKAWYFLYVLFEFGEFAREPYSRVFAGGQRLHRGDARVINLIPRAAVADTYAALRALERKELRSALARIPTGYFVTPPRRDREEGSYVLGWFDKIVEFFGRAGGHHIVFTASIA